MHDEALQCVDVTMLPLQARDLAKIIGLPDTLKILKAYGGHRLFVPNGTKKDTQLQLLITEEGYIKLCKSHLAGSRLTLPKVDKIIEQIRNHHIRTSSDVNKATFARQYDLTQRHVQRIRNDHEENPTLDMFDDPVG